MSPVQFRKQSCYNIEKILVRVYGSGGLLGWKLFFKSFN
ncbi:hypothetical protein MmmBen326_0136 [Mycoplasma mycoides subsp. mycoides]|nr:hypothetical protein MmmBen326_0136 [Mycoplasma mycoides subsp. mycoides]